MVQYFRNIYESIFTVLIGMGVTFKHLFRSAVTLQYPREKKELPTGSRQKLDVDIDDCIGCLQCAKACPVDCIIIETSKAEKDEDLGETSNGKKKRMYLTRFDIDLAKCCYCGDCIHPCPTECIHMTPEYEFASYNRKDFLYKFSNLSPEKTKELKDREKEKLAKKEEPRRHEDTKI